jgi:uncharacterized membrane protein
MTFPAGSRANLYIGAVVAAGAAALALSLRQIVPAYQDGRLLPWVAIAVLTLAFGRLSLRLPLPNCRVSFSDALIFLSVLLFDTELATLTAGLDGFAASTRGGGSWLKRIFNTAGLALSVNLSARLVHRMIPGIGVWGEARTSLRALLVSMVVLAGVQYLFNTCLVAGAVALKESVPFLTVWEQSFSWAGTACLAGSFAAAMVFLAVREIGSFSFLAIAPFPILTYVAYRVSLGRVVESRVPTRG